MTTKLEQDFETWWEREGQEFLYALNTTTDDDIKLVAEIAWKNGAYCAEQAEQEPVAWMWACAECGTEAEDGTDCRICGSCGYHKFYKAPKVATCVCAAKTQEKVKQEPVAWVDLTGAEIGEVWAKHPRDFDKCVAIIEKFKEKNTNPVIAKETPVARMCSDPKLLGSGYSRFSECCAGVWNIPVYAAPVRTKDLSDAQKVDNRPVIDALIEVFNVVMASESRDQALNEIEKLATSIRTGGLREKEKKSELY